MKNKTNFLRVKKTENYVVINKDFLKNRNLSWKAKGILTYILSLPNDWILNISELQNHSKDGSDSLYSGMKELIKYGYVSKKKIKKAGKFSGVEYTISEQPFNLQSPYAGKPDTEKPFSENPALLSNNILSIDKLNKSDSKNESSYPSEHITEHNSTNRLNPIEHNKVIIPKKKKNKDISINNYKLSHKEVITFFSTKLNGASSQIIWSQNVKAITSLRGFDKDTLDKYFEAAKKDKFWNQKSITPNVLLSAINHGLKLNAELSDYERVQQSKKAGLVV